MKLHLINSFLIASSVLIAQPVWADLSHPTPLVTRLNQVTRSDAGGGSDSFDAQQPNDITQVTAVRLNLSSFDKKASLSSKEHLP